MNWDVATSAAGGPRPPRLHVSHPPCIGFQDLGRTHARAPAHELAEEARGTAQHFLLSEALTAAYGANCAGHSTERSHAFDAWNPSVPALFRSSVVSYACFLRNMHRSKLRAQSSAARREIRRRRERKAMRTDSAQPTCAEGKALGTRHGGAWNVARKASAQAWLDLGPAWHLARHWSLSHRAARRNADMRLGCQKSDARCQVPGARCQSDRKDIGGKLGI